jgi:hypothetical protein
MIRLTGGYLRNSLGVSTTMLEAFTSDTSKKSLEQTTRGICTKGQEPSIQRDAGTSGQSLYFKVHSLSGL